MNIFATYNCPIKSAKNLDDSRVIKMILESAQMLSTALRINNAPAPYKSTHVNHPSNIWTRETRSNYIWVVNHMEALSKEYTARYGKIHASSIYIAGFKAGAVFIPAGKLTPFANCAARSDMNINYKHIKNTHIAYRLYLCRRFMFQKNKLKNEPPFSIALTKIKSTLDKLNLLF
jgi:hypothetical protein